MLQYFTQIRDLLQRLISVTGGGYFSLTSNSQTVSGNSNIFSSNTQFAGLSVTGAITKYENIPTAGIGVPAIFGAGLRVNLNTTNTTITSYLPTSATGQMFTVKWNLSCLTNSTGTVTLNYTDPDAGAQSISLFNSAMTGGTVAQGNYSFVAKSTATITVVGTDSVALGDIFASAIIEQGI